MSHQGRVLYFQDNQEAVRARIYDFDIAKAILKPRHMKFLQNRIAPILQAGGSLRLVGRASRALTVFFRSDVVTRC